MGFIPIIGLAGLLIAPPTAGHHWFGPAVAVFETQFSGDPYDPDQNDVRVRFVDEKGKKLDRLAYFTHGTWQAILVTSQPGMYHPVLVRNGEELPDVPALEETLDVETPLQHGFIHADPDNTNRFRYDDGTAYFPVGHDLAWHNPGKLPLIDQLHQMGLAKLTWTRIWSAYWDSRNPWWPLNDADADPNTLWEEALENWSALATVCDTEKVPFQMVLFNHGSFSSTNDSNWPQNPWNKANGGFLGSAADFFTDVEAIRRTKIWLRYAVARFSGDPNLEAFELFNEVEWTDAAKAGRWADIAKWHSDMAAYIRGLDSYDHMITTSSRMDQPAIWSALDFFQPHLYAKDPSLDIQMAKLPTAKPSFYGEFGGSDAKGNRELVRNALYTGFFRNTGGLPMFWDWNHVVAEGLYPELAAAALVVQLSDIGTHPTALSFEPVCSIGKANGLGLTDWAVLRVQNAATGPVKISGLTAAAGDYLMTVVNLADGQPKESTQEIASNSITVALPSGDCIVILKRK